MLCKRLRERHIQTTCMEKLATAIAPEPILFIVIFANLTDLGISPIIEQKIWEVKESVAVFNKQWYLTPSKLTNQGHRDTSKIWQTLFFPFPCPHRNFHWYLTPHTNTEQNLKQTKRHLIHSKPGCSHIKVSFSKWLCYSQDIQPHHSYSYRSVCNVVVQHMAMTSNSIPFWNQQQHCRVKQNTAIT